MLLEKRQLQKILRNLSSLQRFSFGIYVATITIVRNTTLRIVIFLLFAKWSLVQNF